MCAVPEHSAAQCPWRKLLIAQGWSAGVLGPGGFVLIPDTLDKWSQHGREERKPGKECTSLHLQVHLARLAEVIRAGHVWVTSRCANTCNFKKCFLKMPSSCEVQRFGGVVYLLVAFDQMQPFERSDSASWFLFGEASWVLFKSIQNQNGSSYFPCSKGRCWYGRHFGSLEQVRKKLKGTAERIKFSQVGGDGWNDHAGETVTRKKGKKVLALVTAWRAKGKKASD